MQIQRLISTSPVSSNPILLLDNQTRNNQGLQSSNRFQASLPSSGSKHDGVWGFKRGFFLPFFSSFSFEYPIIAQRPSPFGMSLQVVKMSEHEMGFPHYIRTTPGSYRNQTRQSSSETDVSNLEFEEELDPCKVRAGPLKRHMLRLQLQVVQLGRTQSIFQECPDIRKS
jgi:hypothetical protein